MKQIKVTLIFIISLMFIKMAAQAEDVLPKTTADFKKTAVRVLNKKMNSGGTGSILKSDKSGSQILTNKHVCHLIEQGGYVEQAGKNYKVKSYKKFADHDLCLIRVAHNFNINLTVSKTMAKASDDVYVSGHPSLLPHIVSKGHLSDNMSIRLIIGLEPCTDDGFMCQILGGNPVFGTFDSQVVSNLIMPGSSGSAVFNDSGEVVGVVFAGMGELSYGFIVPQKFILYFLATANYSGFTDVGTPVDDGGLKGRIFNYNSCKNNTDNKEFNRLCQRAKHSMIYVRETL